MAIRARPDNLSLDCLDVAPPAAPVVDFAEVWSHRELLRQACLRITGDAARAEDLVQDTFVSALKSGDRLERRASIGPWLTTVARRRSIDEIRSRRRVSVVAAPPDPTPSGTDDPAEHVLNQELMASVRSAIHTLTHRERQLLLRQATYGMSLAELAAEEQTSVASVRSVLARARQKLRMTLERTGALGALPVPLSVRLPRLLASLREKAARWAIQIEAALPALTGATAHAGNVLAAVAAALITLLGTPAMPVERVAMLHGAEAASNDGAGAIGRSGAGAASSAAPDDDPRTAPRTSEPPAPPVTSVVPGLADQLTVPTLPPDSADQVEESNVEDLTASRDGKHIFAAAGTSTGDDAIYKSTDGGATWTRLPAVGFAGGRILLSPNYPADPTLYANGPNALYRSDDGGASFNPVAPGTGQALMSPRFAEGDPRILVAGARIVEYWAGGRISALHATPPGAVRMMVPAASFHTDGAVLVAGTTPTTATPLTGAVYRCTAAGCSAPAVVAGAQKAPRVWKASSGALFAWADRRILRSDDDGASFAVVASPNFMVASFAEEADGDIVIGVRKEDSASAMYRSSDNGVTWSPIGVGTIVATSPSVGEVLVLPNGNLVVGGTVGGGIRCSADGGVTWARRC